MAMSGLRECEMCGDEFKPLAYLQKYCGSRKNQIGCSWENRKMYEEVYFSRPAPLIKRETSITDLAKKAAANIRSKFWLITI